MWLMTTKGRPQAARKAIQQCWDTGMRQPAVMYVDGDPAGYDFTLPDNWTRYEGNGNLAGSKRYLFETYPHERIYGWLADDNWPETPDWSYIVEDRAYPWYLIHCQDKWMSEHRTQWYALRETTNLGAGTCWGGELVRAVGWWSPPNITQASIDWAWTSLVGKTPLGVYLHNVIVRHDNWRTGRRAQDSNDTSIIAETMTPFVRKDIDTIRNWIGSDDFQQTRERVLHGYQKYITGTG